MKKYRGPLGSFLFDENYFGLSNGMLVFTGALSDGAVPCALPEGLECCDNMFAGVLELRVAPALPKSCTSANHMFLGCKNLLTLPDINLALMNSNDFDYTTMFEGCTSLQELCVDVDTNEKLDPYICACERSSDFPQHVQAMQDLAKLENKIKDDDFKQMHRARMRVAEKLKITVDLSKSHVMLPTCLHHSLLLDLPIKTKNRVGKQKDPKPDTNLTADIKQQESTSEIQSDLSTPTKISLEG